MGRSGPAVAAYPGVVPARARRRRALDRRGVLVLAAINVRGIASARE
jgi:hypothetical protein